MLLTFRDLFNSQNKLSSASVRYGMASQQQNTSTSLFPLCSTYHRWEIRPFIRFLNLRNASAAVSMVSSWKSHVSMLPSGFGYLRKSVLTLTTRKEWDIVYHFRKDCAAAWRKILQQSLCSSSTLKQSFPRILQSLPGEILTEILGYRNLCARWVP